MGNKSIDVLSSNKIQILKNTSVIKMPIILRTRKTWTVDVTL